MRIQDTRAVLNAFVAFIGNGDNPRGAFPKTLSELAKDVNDFVEQAEARRPGVPASLYMSPLRCGTPLHSEMGVRACGLLVNATTGTCARGHQYHGGR